MSPEIKQGSVPSDEYRAELEARLWQDPQFVGELLEATERAIGLTSNPETITELEASAQQYRAHLEEILS